METAYFIGLPSEHSRNVPLLISAKVENPTRDDYPFRIRGQYFQLSRFLKFNGTEILYTFFDTAQSVNHAFGADFAYREYTQEETIFVELASDVNFQNIIASGQFEIKDDYPQYAPKNVLFSYDEESKIFSLSWKDDANFTRTGFTVEIQEGSGDWAPVLNDARVWEYSFSTDAKRVRARVKSIGLKNESDWATTGWIDISVKPHSESVEMRLDNVDVLRLLPRFMRDDKAVQGLAKGVGEAAAELDAKLRKFAEVHGYDGFSEEVLDALAEDQNIFWYDKTFPHEKKIEIIASAQAVSERLGTKWAVEKVLSAYFSETKIQEWFEYGGDPFHYKIVSADDSVIRYGAEKLDRIIGKIKRLSVHLDGMSASLDGTTDIAFGLVSHEANIEEFKQEN